MNKKILTGIMCIAMIKCFGQTSNSDSFKIHKEIIIENLSKKDIKSRKIGDTNIVNIGPWVIKIKPKGMEVDYDSGFTQQPKKRHVKQTRNIKTSYLDVDLGLCNIYEQAGIRPTGAIKNAPMLLKQEKSIDVSLFFISQRINLYDRKLNLRWGLGLNWRNYRFLENINLRKDLMYNNLSIRYDSILFTKNKMVNRYFTLPIMLELKLGKGKTWNNFKLAAGISINQYFGAWQKQISAERGKVLFRNYDMNLAQQRVDAIARLGLGRLNFYGSYALTPMFKGNQLNNNYMAKMYPYTFGIQLTGL